MVRPMLGDVELQQVQKIETEADQVWTQHSIPVLEGDFFQGLGRRASWVKLNGVLTGVEVKEGLKTLRDKFRAAQPVDFVADITTATEINQVIIEEMGVQEVAGKPFRFEYAFTLREYIRAPQPLQEDPPPPPPPPPPLDTGTLIVEAIVEGEPSFDFTTVTVTVEGTQEDGATLSRTLTNRENNIWTQENMPPGSYTARAVVTQPQSLSGSALATVRAGQTTQVTITLQRGNIIAKAFVVHFWFDRAFIEPCMRPVMREVVQYASEHSNEKLVIVGHTDKAGSPQYNQSLSERRARSAFAFLTFGIARDAAFAEWNELRQQIQPGTANQARVRDNWGIREYQHILQDLGFYQGNVTDNRNNQLTATENRLTQEAIQAYRCHKGLPPGTGVDDLVWQELIKDYLGQDNFSVTESQFLLNAKDGCNGGILKWLGCGEESPLPLPQPTKPNAWRPYRRVEFLFVNASALPCEVPQPDTFDLPTPGSVGTTWCLGAGNPNKHDCFIQRNCTQPAQNPNHWCVEPANPTRITVRGTITREDGTPHANQPFILIAADGQIKGNEAGDGVPVPGRTKGAGDPNPGSFEFTDLPVGVYSLEVVGEFLVRLAEDGDDKVKGNTVCKRLNSDSDTLNVVIVNAPLLREIRLPVAVHLMTALHPATREIRTCPTGVSGAAQPQATAHTEADIRAFFAEANRIWRQARVRFELTDIVSEAYAFRTDCEVDHSEFEIILERCAYKNAVNVFFFGDLAGTGEAGFGVSVENGAALGIAGCAVGDRFQSIVLGVTSTLTLNPEQSIQVLAHELGHFLNLQHTADTSSNADRLMFPTGALDGSNRRLITDEVSRARSSLGARQECRPLGLQVTGATQVGGSLSDEFIVLQNPTSIVTVDAVAPETGTVVMTGGTAVSERQHTVSTATTGETEIVATYTPTSGTESSTTRVKIRVATFRLRVEGATQVGGASSNTYITTVDSGAVVTVIAQIDPEPFCVPSNLVTWINGNSTADPLRRKVSRSTITSTTVSATLTSTGESQSVNIFVVRVTLDVDADRDGIVEENAIGKNNWEFGADRKGAVILCNNDNDNKATGNLEIDSENAVVDGANDISDIVPLIIRRSGIIPAGASLVLSVVDASKVRIFNQRSATATAIIGPGLANEVIITTNRTTDVEFGIEATQYADGTQAGKFNGLIRMALVLKVGSTEISRDEVRVRVAPWVMPSHLDVTEEIYVVNIPGSNTVSQTPGQPSFIAAIQAVADAAGISLIRADGDRYLSDRWIQDTMEIGFSRIPNKEIAVTLDAVRTRGLDPYPINELLGTDYGLTQVLTADPENTFDSHGNLEVTPPVTVRNPVTGEEKEFKFGRIYYGGIGRRVDHFNQDVKQFLEAQLIQKPFEVDTSWLGVGHVDEIISFIPANVPGTKNFRMLLSSVTVARQILTDLQNAGNGSLTLFTGKTSSIISRQFRQVTIDALLADTRLRIVNDDSQAQLNDIEDLFKRELGLTSQDIIKIPSLFVDENPRSPGLFAALIPGMVNMLVITRPNFADHQLAIPKPFGPVVAGEDQLEKAMRDRLIPLGYTASQIRFIDDFDTYHILLGEVHCGTNSKRRPPTTPWWEQEDI